MARAAAVLAERGSSSLPGLKFWLASLHTNKMLTRKKCGRLRDASSKSNCRTSTAGSTESYSVGEYLYDLQEIREALALVSAVAHVDQEAWKFALNKIWRFKLGNKGSEKQEQDIPARFELVFDPMAAYNGQLWHENRNDMTPLRDLVFFCGTEQRTSPTPEYLTGLRQIAARAGRKILPEGKPGLDVKILIQVAFSDKEARMFDPFNNIVSAEKAVKDAWRNYEQRTGNQAVPSGTIRCTFELGPMVAELTDCTSYYKRAPKVHELVVRDNVWFSKMTLSTGGDFCDEPDAIRENFRLLSTAAFHWERNSPRRASTALYSNRGVYLREGSPL